MHTLLQTRITPKVSNNCSLLIIDGRKKFQQHVCLVLEGPLNEHITI